jgi:hypothetical protein
MALYFQNLYSDTIWFAFLYFDPSCSGTSFKKIGWYQVNPGQTINFWNTDLRSVNRYAAFYAEEYRDSGGATWSGTGNNWYLVPDVAFNQCYDDNTNCNQQPDFVPLDFNGFSDMTVTLGPAAGQLNVQGSLPPLPAQLDFDWSPIVFNNGVPVGGSSHLTIHQDGTYHFTGQFHDSGAFDYNLALAWAVKDSQNQVYTFAHTGHVAGTFGSGSRDDIWQNDGQNDALTQNWANIVAANSAFAQASANSDVTSLVNSLIGALGTVLGVIAIIVA